MADITKRTFNFAKKETFSLAEVEDLINQNDKYNESFNNTKIKEYEAKVKETESKYRNLEIEAIELPSFEKHFIKAGGKPEGVKRFFKENEQTWAEIKNEETKIVEFVNKAREDKNNAIFFNPVEANVSNKFTKNLNNGGNEQPEYYAGSIYKVRK
jgi:hypothetical protein